MTYQTNFENAALLWCAECGHTGPLSEFPVAYTEDGEDDPRFGPTLHDVRECRCGALDNFREVV